MDLNVLTYIGIGVAAVLFILVYIFYKPKKKTAKTVQNLQPQNDTLTEIQSLQQPNEAPTESKVAPVFEVISKEGVINAVVFDDATRSYGRRHVELIPGKDYGRPSLYFNNLVFNLHRLSTGEIIPIGVSPYRNMEHSPGETFEAVKNTEDMREVFGKKSPADKVKLTLFILGALAALFIGWMAVQSKGGG